MLLQLRRTVQNAKSTVGELIAESGQVLCVTLEDAYHEPKIMHSTRIPSGTYQIGFRTVGGFHWRYLKRFGSIFHRGMLWLLDVPDFQYILVHCGNTIADTDGCILVGATSFEPQNESEPYEIRGSERAYKEIYPVIRDALLRKEDVFIQVIDP